MDWMPQAIREGLFTILFISGPLVLLAAGLGLSIGIIQAATQVQEQTLASAVKIIGLFLALMIFGFYMFQYMRQYTTDNLERAFRLVPSLGSYIKPRKNFLTQKLEKDELDPFKSPAELNPENLPPKGAPKITGDILNEPDIVSNNVKVNPNQLGTPSSQIKLEDTNLKKQDIHTGKPIPQIPVQTAPKPVAQAPAQTAPKPVAQAPVQTAPKPVPQTAPKPAAQAPITQAAKPVPRVSNPNPPTITVREEPKAPEPERKSISDALSRIKNSIEDFNRSQEAATP